MSGAHSGSQSASTMDPAAPETGAARRRGRWLAEVLGAGTALTLSLIAVGHVVGSERAGLLFTDGDSVLPALVRQSIVAGEPQDWALSAVLFIPEMALYFAIAALGLSTKATLAVSAVVNFVLLYAALRSVAALVRPGHSRARQVAGALAALAALVALALLDGTRDRYGLELPSLLVTTTYYSTTLFALVVATGVTAAVLARGKRVGGRTLPTVLLALSAVAVLSNPLYIAWVAAPLIAIGLVLVLAAVVDRRTFARAAVPLGLGSVAGMLLRVPFSPLITNGLPYAHLTLQREVALYYLGLLVQRLSTPIGLYSITAIVFLVSLNVVFLVRSIRRRDVAAAVLTGMGCIAPVAVTVGAILVGAIGSRYLQPVFFAPVISLVLLPGLRVVPRFRFRWTRMTKVAALAAALTVLTGVSSAAAVEVRRSVVAVDSSLQCVVDWVTASGRTGAGQFWVVRGPKAYLSNPRQLVQVDGKLNGYYWLTNRSDYDRRAVSFLLAERDTGIGATSGNDSAAPKPRGRAARLPHTTVRCGRYIIYDYHRDVLEIGPMRAIPSLPPQHRNGGKR